jgi:hypothetical protein
MYRLWMTLRRTLAPPLTRSTRTVAMVALKLRGHVWVLGVGDWLGLPTLSFDCAKLYISAVSKLPLYRRFLFSCSDLKGA